MESRNIAIIVAGGSGKRFGRELPKQFLHLKGRRVIEYSIEKFYKEGFDQIVIASHPDFFEIFSEITSNYPQGKIKLVKGGKTRQESVYNALQSSVEDNQAVVLIHDSARPLVSTGLIQRVVLALKESPAVIPAVKVRESVVKARDSRVISYEDRDTIFLVQTPQGFSAEIIKEAHRRAATENKWDFTDDASMVLHYRLAEVKIVEGESSNIKITYPEDLEVAESILR